MRPERFAALLDAGTADAPPAPPPAADLAAGRRRLRRQRLAVGTGTAVLVVGAAALGLGLRGGSEPRGVEPVTPPAGPSPSATCRAALPPSFFPSATEVASDESDRLSLVEFASSDGRHWAACELAKVEGTDVAQVTTYDATGDHLATLEQEPAPGCAEAVGCPTWALTVYDRVDPAVATVVFRLWDGSTHSVPTHDGFYAFAHSDQLPDGVAWSESAGLTGSTYQDPQLLQVTYLDASGRPLASAMVDGTGTGPDQAGVEQLPRPWELYPSLKGQL